MLRVTGDSMVPSLYPGAMVRIRKAEPSNVALGDLVAFLRDGRLFIHRVVFASNGQLVTRGDAHNHPDPVLNMSDVIGLVTPVSSGHGNSVRRMLRRVSYRFSSWISSASTGTR
jgi:signal peptidase I